MIETPQTRMTDFFPCTSSPVGKQDPPPVVWARSCDFLESHQVHKTVALFYCTEMARYLLGKGGKENVFTICKYGFKCDNTK